MLPAPVHPDEVSGCAGVQGAILQLANLPGEAAAFQALGLGVGLNLFEGLRDFTRVGTHGNFKQRYSSRWAVFVLLAVAVLCSKRSLESQDPSTLSWAVR